MEDCFVKYFSDNLPMSTFVQKLNMEKLKGRFRVFFTCYVVRLCISTWKYRSTMEIQQYWLPESRQPAFTLCVPLLDILASQSVRFKALLAFTEKFAIDSSIRANVYYKSGVNMYKQFNMYYREESWENALSIYVKYEKLFFDKIKKHPEYAKVPVNIKSVNASNFRIIKQKAEHAKKELLKQYQFDYDSLVEELKTNIFEENPVSASVKPRQIPLNPPNFPFKRYMPYLDKLSMFDIKSHMSFDTSRRLNNHLKLKRQTEDQQKAKKAESNKSLIKSETPLNNKNTGGYHGSVITNPRLSQKLSYI